MTTFLELRGGEGIRLVPLDQERMTVGKSTSNDLSLPEDPKVSRLHAVLERYAAGWSVRDLDSRNGTFVNGERVAGERPLHPGDEIRIGETQLTYRSDESWGTSSITESAERPPEVTRREREVLLELCRPALSGNLFSTPASTREIAEALVISEEGVRQHLARLYEKFGIREQADRRVRLAAESVRRGAVSLTDLRAARDEGT